MKWSIRKKLIGIIAAIIIIGTVMIALIVTSVFKEKIISAAQEKLMSDMATATALLDLTYHGEWTVKDGKLYKGDVLLNDNFEFVDNLGAMTGDTVTIFLGDTRISTNVKAADGKRAVGTTVSEKVAKAVLQDKGSYKGKAEVAGVWNQTIYNPIKDSAGNVIGILYVGVPNTPYDEMAMEFQTKVYLFGLIQIAASIILIGVFANVLSRNIKKVKGVAEKIANGELTVSANINSHDEMEELGNALNQMAENLKQLILSIHETAETMLASSEELSASAEENTAASEHMADMMGEIAEGNNHQQKSVSEVANVAQQIAMNAKELANTAGIMASMTHETVAATKKGVVAVERAVVQMDNISQSNNEVHQAIEELNVSSQKISEIANVISSIADQTNLLALNAAIEAARAGDSGRGFAVVAEEVRKLAEQSQNATQQITGLVLENQKNIDHANQAMKSGVEDVREGIQVANSAKSSFAQVESLANSVADQIDKISKAITQVADGNQNTVKYIEEVVSVSKKTSEQATSASCTTQQQSATIQETALIANAVAKLAEELKGETDRFRF